MRKVRNLRELQIIQCNILYDLVAFCKSNNIVFYLLGGTLIGAVRHGGFIPWDDDMDIAMSRPEYEKLLKKSSNGISKRCSLLDPELDKNYKGYIPQIIYNKSKLVSGQYRTDENLKIGISVFVYDGVPNNKIFRKLYYYQMYMFRVFHALCRVDFKNVVGKANKMIGSFLVPFTEEKNVYKYRDKVLKHQKKFRYEYSKKISPNADTKSFLEDVEKSRFEKALEKEFEGISCHVFSYYKEHLIKYYGDYMQLPPVEQRIQKHSFNAWIEENFENRLL